MNKRRVVVTGMGAVTPLGGTAGDSWAAAKAGVCGIGPITLYDPSAMKVKLAGEVRDFDPERYMEHREARRMDRFTQFAMAAAAQAVEQSGLDMEREDPARCGVMVSSGIVSEQERDGAGRVLNAAFMTYVAAVISSLLTLLYYILRATSMNRD